MGKTQTIETRSLPKLLVITGPTGSGKSSLAKQLARKFSGEIIAADSRQIYREMDIGTDKTTGGRQEGIPHHLVDMARPDEIITLQLYKRRAVDAIFDILKRSKLPILEGGTYLYVQAVVDNLEIPKVPPHSLLRNQLGEKDTEFLLKELRRVDPEAAQTIDMRNKRRVIRALEVNLLTGSTFSAQRKKGKPLFNAFIIGIALPREKLYEKISRRIDSMIEEGLVDEVQRLLDAGYNPSLPSLSGIGYQEIIRYLRDEISIEKAVQDIKQHSRQFARRQLTWLRSDKRVHWVSNYSEAEKIVSEFIG